MRLQSFFLITLSMIQAAVAIQIQSLIKAGNITIPSEDPFYIPKAGFENLKPGELINYRKIDHAYGIVAFEEKIQAAYQLLVRSEDTFGNATAIVTTVMVPYNADPSKILSYQAAVDSSDPNCAPSYALQLGSDPSTWITTQIEQLVSQAGLYEGWIVVIPDFLGPKAAFGAGYQAAHATLDSLRAVVQSGDITGVNKDAEVVLWGYSGGSQPTMWAAAMVDDYAPEVNIIGAAAGGVLVSPTSIANQTMDGFFAGLIVNAINGLANEYPDLKQFVKDNFYKDVLGSFFNANNKCLIPSLIDTFYTNWDDLSPIGNQLLEAPLVKNITAENSLLNLDAKPNVPVFFYNTKGDEIIPPKDTDELYEKWCGEGVAIEYHQDEIGEHITEMIAGSGAAFNWLKRRFAGETTETTCKKTVTFSNALSFEGITGLAEIVGDIYDTVEGKKIGPSSPPKNTTITVSSSSSAKNGTTTASTAVTATLSVSKSSSAATLSASKTSSTSTSTSTSSSLLGSILNLIF